MNIALNFLLFPAHVISTNFYIVFRNSVCVAIACVYATRTHPKPNHPPIGRIPTPSHWRRFDANKRTLIPSVNTHTMVVAVGTRLTQIEIVYE